MGFKDIVQEAVIFWDKHNTKILTVVGVAGAIVTPILASRATLKAEKVVNEFNEKQDAADNNPVDNDTEENGASDHEEKKWYKDVATLKRLAKIYAVPFTTLVLTIAAIISCDRIHVNNEAGLAALAYALQNRCNIVEKKYEEKFGKEALAQIKKEIQKEQKADQKKSSEGKSKKPKDDILEKFWVNDVETGQEFLTSHNDIIWTNYYVNYRLQHGQQISWAEIISCLGGKYDSKGTARFKGYNPSDPELAKRTRRTAYKGYKGVEWIDIHVRPSAFARNKGAKSEYTVVTNYSLQDLLPFN